MRILYLTYDLADPASHKRVRMLVAGGAEVVVAGFRRSDTPIATIENCAAIDLGRSYPARFLHRVALVLRTVYFAKQYRACFENADLVIARNLEMLAIAVRGLSICESRAPLVYECLDIHRLMLREDRIGRALRALEGWLSRRARLLVTSSPAFVREYFEARSRVALPVRLIENKVLRLEGEITPAAPPAAQNPWRIGWFGVLRCRKSFEALAALVRDYPGLVEVVMRGRPAYDQLPDLEARVAATPGLSFGGPFAADEVTGLYQSVHFAWAIDCFEEGQNSRWLLPNRLYDSGYYGAVPLALEGVETAAFIMRLGIGHRFADLLPTTLAAFFASLTPEACHAMHQAVAAIPRDLWRFTREDCRAIVAELATLTPARAPVAASSRPPLVVIPCLNEIAHIDSILSYLVTESRSTPMTIVVADGGSTDSTVEIIQRYAAAHEHIHYLPNPKRIQSAAINLAVATYGDSADYLIRLDAHADFPPGYCQTLLNEAADTGADSVVVSMRTRGAGLFQKAVAMAQNSKLGNGGSAHRLQSGEGKWVDHGHHALMRLDAFRAVGGYDETFTHNEDAELDIRLARAGYRHWLTAKTAHDYFPRASVPALFKQYRHYGRGRARTTLKHQIIPKLRQSIPLLVAPACALLLLSPLVPLAALPFLLWAAVCLGYGALLAKRSGHALGLLSGPAAMVMHSGWSLGFWQEFLAQRKVHA